MATLYVENVPDELYEALKQQAQRERRSMAAEVISILEREVPTAAAIERRRDAVRRVLEFGATRGMGPGPSGEEMIREDRER